MQKLRVTHIPQLGMDAVFHVPVSSVEEGVKVKNLLACYDIFQLDNRIKPDFSNTSFLEIFDEGEWCSWYLDTEDYYWDNPEDYLENNKDVQRFITDLFGQLKK